ncbi:basic amino acid ABC transporter substrate-binding protein [Cohnella sp. WQ 127256]|uniref:basic amino acid ABC transporter substrate-binding protein n=1 Tax=Cohnella sp. WQ 127256 TaxID=2938790 RepID=UPI002119B429|nr:basic amino acid ABC transporter substrate-binding protein [Cohnella sp. WQ 127256]
MRKAWLIALVVGLVLVLASCGAKEDKSGSKNDEGGAEVKVYQFATDATYPPMESMDKETIVGFDIDFLAAVMEEAGLEYEIKNIGWDALLESVKTGSEFDGGISSITISEERKQTYDFSIPYFESTNMILVKEGSDIKNAQDLKGKKVAVQGATTGDKLMTGIMGEGNNDLKRFESNALALLEMESNGVDAVVADNAIIQEYTRNNPDKKFVTIYDRENFESEYYGIAFPKGSELKAKLDPAIKTVLESDKYKEMYKKWTQSEADMAGLLSAQ